MTDYGKRPKGLTDAQIEAAYRYREHLYHEDDAEQHMRDYLEYAVNLPPEVVEKTMDGLRKGGAFSILADRFEDSHDCEIADNAQWNGLISDYVAENHLA